MSAARRYLISGLAILISGVVFLVPFTFILLMALKDRREASIRSYTLPTTYHMWENLIEVIQTRNYMLLTAFLNSVILTVASVTLLVILGAMAGFVLQRHPSKWTGLVNFFARKYAMLFRQPTKTFEDLA